MFFLKVYRYVFKNNYYLIIFFENEWLGLVYSLNCTGFSSTKMYLPISITQDVERNLMSNLELSPSESVTSLIAFKHTRFTVIKIDTLGKLGQWVND